MRWNSPESGTSRSTRGNEMHAALAVHYRMNFIQHHGSDICEHGSAPVGAQQQIEALRCCDQDFRGLAQHAAPLGLGGVAASYADSDGRQMFSGSCKDRFELGRGLMRFLRMSLLSALSGET